MRERGIAGLRFLALAAAVAACAGPPREAGEGSAVVVRVEQAAWNAPPEPGLFRVSFDAARAQDIRRRAAYGQSPEGLDPYFAEVRILEEEAEHEMRARGFCSGSAKLVSRLDGQPGIAAIFKCRPSLF